MSRRVPKNFNGLVPIGGTGHVPMIGQNQSMGQPSPEQRKMAILAQMQAMMDEMFIRAASQRIAEGPDGTSQGDWQWMAQRCHAAAEGYFVGLGIIELDPPKNASDEPVGDKT